MIFSAGLMFFDKDIDQRQRHRALQSRIDLFNEVLGAELGLVGGQGVRVSIFGGGFRTFLVDVCSCLGEFKTSLVDVCNCLGAKDITRAFGQSYW